VKLVHREAESEALRRWLDDRPGTGRFTSAITRVELVRALRRAAPPSVEPGRLLLEAVDLVALPPDLLDEASMLDPLSLRSLDAVHLATAARAGGELEAVVSYDRRLLDAARALGLPVLSPA
jgi:uncharacterized protein